MKNYIMREIKFRAWHKMELILGEVKNLTKKGVFLTGLTPEGDKLYPSGIMVKGVKDGRFVPFKEIEISQYTGLKDKNDKEIYEGDICRILYTDWPSQTAEKNGRYLMSLDEYKKSISTIMVVKFFAPSFLLSRDNGTCSNINPGKHGEIAIIGNLYENPELLNEGKKL